MISLPLFKQSVKANWVSWLMVTLASCMIFALLIFILGTLDVNELRSSLKNVFTDADDKAEIQSQAIDGYQGAYDVYTESLDNYTELTAIVDKAVAGTAAESEYDDFSTDFKDAITALADGQKQINKKSDELAAAEKELAAGQKSYEQQADELKTKRAGLVTSRQQLLQGIDTINAGLTEQQANLNVLNTNIAAIQAVYDSASAADKADYDQQLAILTAQKSAVEQGIAAYQAKLSETQATLNAVNSGIAQIDQGLASAAAKLEAAEEKIETGRKNLDTAKKKLASKKQELIDTADDEIIDSITAEVYDTAMDEENDAVLAGEFKQMSSDVIAAYKQGQDVSTGQLQKWAENYITAKIYDEAIKDHSADDAATAKKIAVAAIGSYVYEVDSGILPDDAKADVSEKLSEQLDPDVTDALTELGDMDVYGLVVGSIAFRIAGLLLPMVYVIMTSNNLLAGQVDSGSLAFVLSTPIKRKKVALTQMAFLLVSLVCMYLCTTATTLLCTYLVSLTESEFDISYKNMILFNVGSLCTIVAISGICYCSSAWFDRSKNAIGFGGGITMFSFVCTIMGLFGSEVVPSAVRIEAMNCFNYVSLITLFDTTSILNGTTAYIWKLAILFGGGLLLYAIGIAKFDKKDLPL